MKTLLLVVALTSASDIRSSWSKYELNPVLGNGRFGARQATISIAGTATATAAIVVLCRRHPKVRNWSLANIAAGHGVAAIHNLVVSK
jgi:hypothetical protein